MLVSRAMLGGSLFQRLSEGKPVVLAPAQRHGPFRGLMGKLETALIPDSPQRGQRSDQPMNEDQLTDDRAA